MIVHERHEDTKTTSDDTRQRRSFFFSNRIVGKIATAVERCRLRCALFHALSIFQIVAQAHKGFTFLCTPTAMCGIKTHLLDAICLHHFIDLCCDVVMTELQQTTTALSEVFKSYFVPGVSNTKINSSSCWESILAFYCLPIVALKP